MAAWTGVSFWILRRVDEDEDLSPRVLAMTVLEKAVGGARGLAKMEGSDGRLL